MIVLALLNMFWATIAVPRFVFFVVFLTLNHYKNFKILLVMSTILNAMAKIIFRSLPCFAVSIILAISLMVCVAKLKGEYQMSNSMFFLVVGYDELDNGHTLCNSSDLNEIIDYVRHKPITPYDYDWLAIYSCNTSPIHIRFVDGKILLD